MIASNDGAQVLREHIIIWMGATLSHRCEVPQEVEYQGLVQVLGLVGALVLVPPFANDDELQVIELQWDVLSPDEAGWANAGPRTPGPCDPEHWRDVTGLWTPFRSWMA